MRTDRLLVALFLGTSLLANRLEGQDPRLTVRLPGGVARAVQATIDGATQAGLPADPLVQKALEGWSKGADSARIVAAVQNLATLLGRARRALGGVAPEADLIAGAAALRAGAEPGTLATLRGLRPSDPLAVPLSVLADLLTAGVGPERAWSSVREMASRGASDAAFLRLREDLVPSGSERPLPPAVERPPGTPLPTSRDRP